jgi:cytochrome c biogenesis protein
MKYDGVARRSQKSNPNLIDRIWNFFSSVKIAVILIVITLLAASLGTIYPQESIFINVPDPAQYYADNYGTPGKIYYALGLSRIYESWWFITLLVMIGTSLVVCSLDRVLPLYRALSKQQIRKHPIFLQRQKVNYTGEVEGDPQEWVDRFAGLLRRKRYRVHIDGTALFAEKNRFSRWGPYINHIGLIVFLLAVLSRTIPGWYMNEYISLLEGETKPIPNTPYYLKNEQFTIEYYQDDEVTEGFRKTGRVVPKQFETKAVLYECTANCDDPLQEPVLKEVMRHNIVVNDPLQYHGLMLYQFDFSETPMLNSVKAALKNKRTGEQYGTFELRMRDPDPVFTVGPYTLTILQKYMEFSLDENNQPITLSRDPKAPAFVFNIRGPGLPEGGAPYLYFPRQADKERFRQDEINGELAEWLEISVDRMEDVDFSMYTTHLNVRTDKAVPYIWAGAVISVLGLAMGFYWHHRRIWLRIDGTRLTLGAHTNKNLYGMRNDVAQALRQMDIDVDPKSLALGGRQT